MVPTLDWFFLPTLGMLAHPRTDQPLTAPHSDVSGNTTIDGPSFHTPNTCLSDATSTNSDSHTPALSEVTSNEDPTPFNDARALPKYGADTPLSPTELELRVAHQPLGGSVACNTSGKIG